MIKKNLPKLIITSLVILIPMLIGLILWDINTDMIDPAVNWHIFI